MKPNIIFRKKVPLEYFFSFLEKLCPNSKEYYMIDKIVFSKMIRNNLHNDFLDFILQFYHESKKFYVTRELNYNSFGNIIRQICHLHSLSFLTNKIYNHSQYTIRYVIDRPSI